MSDRIDLSEKLATFSEHWSPRTVTQFNKVAQRIGWLPDFSVRTLKG